MLDLVIRDGQIVDGTGAVRRPADLGIRGGRIVSIGAVDEPATREISADGAIVAPGFIDVHTHYDAQVMWDPTLSPSCLHGVTTVFGGNCGFSLAPLSADAADYLMRMLARVEGMPLAALSGALDWDWSSTADFLGMLDGTLSLNAGFMVGHSAIRRVVMGDDSNVREATAIELEAMAALLRAGLAAGGMGFTSSLAASHSDASGDPVPSRAAGFDELLALAAVCGEFDGTSLEMVPGAGQDFPEPIKELMVQMSARAGRALNWNILNPRSTNLDEVESKLSVGDRAAAAGGKVVGLVMPLPILLRLNLESGFLFDMLPGWGQPMALPTPAKMELFGNREERENLQRQAAGDSPMKMFGNWGNYIVRDCFTESTKRYEGRRIAEIAAEEHKSEFDVFVDIALADGLRTSFERPAAIDTEADWEARLNAMRDPRTLVGASDAGAHLDMIDTFAYPTHLLQSFVREHGLTTTEEIVHMMTAEPAELYGLRDRGVLREGAWADVVVFDEQTVGPATLRTRHDLPSGAGRLFAESEGVDTVIVNGDVIVEQGTITPARPGTVLRSGRDTTTAR